MEDKRKISILIPYKIRDDKISVYLQKRSKNAKRLPDYFGFFGGGIEHGENPQEALVREIKEEMAFMPQGYEWLGEYEGERSIKYVFILGVDDDFEKKIEVLEGEYGKYFTEDEALHEPKLTEDDKRVLGDLYKKLK